MASNLITPNFSSDSSGKHTEYIEQLSRKYATLSKLALEEPHLEVAEDRIPALRQRVQEAWSRAEGNPASGKWVRITRLLRMGVTSGRGGKWVGARADAKSTQYPENTFGWISTMSESDWNEWEQKFNQDQKLKNMVETWKKGVEVPTKRSKMVPMPHPVAKDLRRVGSSGSQMESASDKQNTVSIDPLRSSAPFGFGVVKRTSQTNVLNGKPDAPSNVIPSDRRGLASVSEAPEGAGSRRRKGQAAGDIEPSSMHPSFSGPQLLTSTPKKTAKPAKPLMTRPAVSSPLTPLISSPSQRTLLGRALSLASPTGHNETGPNDLLQRGPSNRVASAVSLPVIPPLESPPRHTTPQPAHSETHDLLNTNNKRILTSSHSYPIAETDSRKSKKAKTISSNKPAPQTPPRARLGQLPTTVPTLTELLASAKKTKRKRPMRKELDHKQHSTPEPRRQAQTSGDGEEEEITPFFDPFPVDDGGGNIQESGGLAADNRQPDYSHLNDFNAGLASPNGGEEEEVLGHIITGGEIDDFMLDLSFRPLATSTQLPADHERRRGPLVSNVNLGKSVITQPDDPPRPVGNAADSWESIYAVPPQGNAAFPGLSAASSPGKNKNNDASFPQLSYNSEFESGIAAQVEKVNKLLQRDVNHGLSNTPVKDRERGGDDSDDSLDGSNGRSGSMKEGRSGYNYGYGKAFEYDQSF